MRFMFLQRRRSCGISVNKGWTLNRRLYLPPEAENLPKNGTDLRRESKWVWDPFATQSADTPSSLMLPLENHHLRAGWLITSLARLLRCIYLCIWRNRLSAAACSLSLAGATLRVWGAGSSLWRLLLLRSRAPGAQAQQWCHMGLTALLPVGSSQIRDGTQVPWISRQILNPCTTREVPSWALKSLK